MRECIDETDRMYTTDESAHPDPIVFRSEFRPASALATENSETVISMLVERCAVQCKRRDDGYLLLRQLDSEAVFLEYRIVAPPPRPIELRNDKSAILQSHLIYTILIAIQRKNSPVATAADSLQRLENEVGREICIGQIRQQHTFS